MAATRYAVISLDAPELDVPEALRRMFQILNKDGGLGWEFGIAVGERSFIVYRDAESDEEFAKQLERVRDLVGGAAYAYESDINGGRL